MRTNQQRAAVAIEALKIAADARGEKYDGSPDDVMNLVTDLLHLAKLRDIRTDTLLNDAKVNFVAESLSEGVIFDWGKHGVVVIESEGAWWFRPKGFGEPVGPFKTLHSCECAVVELYGKLEHQGELREFEVELGFNKRCYTRGWTIMAKSAEHATALVEECISNDGDFNGFRFAEAGGKTDTWEPGDGDSDYDVIEVNEPNDSED